MHIILYILTLISPLVALPFSFFMLLTQEKGRKHYMIQTSISLAFFAYCWNPDSKFDLFVWHNSCKILSTYNLIQIIEMAINKGEPINLLLKYIIGLTGNYNLLEFIVVLTTFLLLNLYIYNVSKSKKLNKSQFAFIYIFINSIFIFVNFISGLFFNFGLIFIISGIYLIYNNKKRLGFILLFLSFFIHSGMLFPILMFLLFYLNKSKFTFKNIVLFVTVAFFITSIIPIILEKISFIPVFNEISYMYQAYFLSEKQSATNLGYFQLINIIGSFPLMYLLIFDKNYKNDKISSFAAILWISSIIVDFKSPIFIRYVYPANVLFLFAFCEYIKNYEHDNIINKKFFITIVLGTVGILLVYQCKLLSDIDALSIYMDNVPKWLFSIF